MGSFRLGHVLFNCSHFIRFKKKLAETFGRTLYRVDDDYESYEL